MEPRDAVQLLCARARRNMAATRRENQASAQPRCLCCALRAQIRETERAERVFCGTRCQSHLHGVQQFFRLGMKRGAGALEEEAPQIFVWPDFFPDDVLCLLLRWAYGDELRSEAEMAELWQTRSTSPQFKRVIDDCVVPLIHTLAYEILRWITGATLRRFVGLREITILPAERGRADGEILATLPQLQRLTLEYSSGVTLEQLDAVAPRLTFFSLHNISGKFDLATMPALRELVFKHTRVDWLITLDSLECLIIHYNSAGRALPSLPSLRRIAITEYIGIDGLADAVPSLTALRLGACSDGRGIPIDEVASLTALRALDLRGNNMRYGDDLLAAMPSLESLLLDKNALFTDAGLRSCPALRSLALGNFRNAAQITGASVSALGNLTWLSLADWQPVLEFALLGELRVLDLRARGDIYGKDEIGHLTNLHTLILDANTTVTGATLRALTQLEVLSLVANVVIQAEDLEPLLNLRVLNIQGVYSLGKDDPLPYLPRLETLYMSGGGRDYRRFAPGLPRLQRLRYSRAPHTMSQADDTAWLRARGVLIEYATGAPFSYPLPEVWYEGASRAFNAEWDSLAT